VLKNYISNFELTKKQKRPPHNKRQSSRPHPINHDSG